MWLGHRNHIDIVGELVGEAYCKVTRGRKKQPYRQTGEEKRSARGNPPLPGVTVCNCQGHQVGTGTTMYSLVPKFLSQVPATIRI
jgi:hypothetical protein